MIQPYIKSWMDYLDIQKLKEDIGTREILLWGTYPQSEILCDFLKKQGFQVGGFLNMKSQISTFCNLKVYEPSFIRGKSECYFIIVPLNGIRTEILDQLAQSGYLFEKDFLYLFYSIQLMSCYHFSDKKGNEVYSNTFLKNCKIEINGYENKIYIGKNFTYGENIQIHAYHNSTIRIGDNCFIDRGSCMIATGNATISIGNNLRLEHDCNITCISGDLKIGNDFSSSWHLDLVCEINAPITIGNDCMFSHHIAIRSGDGHTIFDLNKKSSLAALKSRYVHIGNHVWVGMGATVLYNTDIQDNSIVGASSFVNRSYPGNCIIAGNPSRIIRENISWERENNIDFEDWIKHTT